MESGSVRFGSEGLGGGLVEGCFGAMGGGCLLFFLGEGFRVNKKSPNFGCMFIHFW